MPPPEDRPSILDSKDDFDRYHKAAQDDSSRVLALVAKGVDDMNSSVDDMKAEQVQQGENFTVLQSDFTTHCKAPIIDAHNIPPGWKPCEVDAGSEKKDDNEETIKMKPKTLFILIFIVSTIATGGTGLASYLGIIGG